MVSYGKKPGGSAEFNAPMRLSGYKNFTKKYLLYSTIKDK
jgi:hypothetical protein